MTDPVNANGTAPLQAESATPSELSGLNARTARRQKLLLGSLGALSLLGGSWFILGGGDKAKTGDPNGPGLPQWARYDARGRAYLLFGNEGPQAKSDLRSATCHNYVAKLTRDLQVRQQ